MEHAVGYTSNKTRTELIVLYCGIALYALLLFIALFSMGNVYCSPFKKLTAHNVIITNIVRTEIALLMYFSVKN